MERITITSTREIIVTPNLRVKDLTNPDSMNPNKLRAIMDWNEEPVRIVVGLGEYPAHIAEWNTVKALEEARILTVQRPYKVEKAPQPKQNKEAPKL